MSVVKCRPSLSFPFFTLSPPGRSLRSSASTGRTASAGARACGASTAAAGPVTGLLAGPGLGSSSETRLCRPCSPSFARQDGSRRVVPSESRRGRGGSARARRPARAPQAFERNEPNDSICRAGRRQAAAGLRNRRPGRAHTRGSRRPCECPFI